MSLINYPVRLITIDEERADQRIDNFLISQFKRVPKVLFTGSFARVRTELIKRGSTRLTAWCHSQVSLSSKQSTKLSNSQL